MARVHSLAISLFLVLSTLFLVHPTSAKPSGFSLKLIPMDLLSQPNRIETMVEVSKARAHYLEAILNPNASKINFDMNSFDALYAVKVLIGAPKESRMLQMDTASGLIWTQCAPCVHCFNQSDPIFDGRKSLSYRKLPARHPICRTPPYKRFRGQCIYGLKYGGRGAALTKGVLSLENFWLPYGNLFFPKGDMIFGCSNDNQNFNFDKSRRISGILGMNRSPESFVKQLDDFIKGRFSYCLVGTNNTRKASTGVLSFGRDVYVPRNARSTPFAPVTNNLHYYLNLLDISIAGHRIGFPPGTFSVKASGTGGCVIDTGTLATLIVPSAYGRVIEAFQKYFQPLKLQKLRNVKQGFDLCFQLRKGFNEYPSMTFHFQGADLLVEPQNVHVIDTVANYFCVALLKGKTQTILGSLHQQDMLFVYDLNKNVLQFAQC